MDIESLISFLMWGRLLGRGESMMRWMGLADYQEMGGFIWEFPTVLNHQLPSNLQCKLSDEIGVAEQS